MSNRKNFDIVVVGGGLIGASMACALSHLPLKIAIVEAFPFRSNNQPSYDARSIALSYGSKKIFETLKLWQSLKPDACPIKQIHVSNKGRFGVTRINAHEENLEALGYVVENRIIGNTLLENISQHKNIELICPATLMDIDITEDNAQLTLSQKEKTRVLNAKLIIGADGANSKVRELIDIESSHKDYNQTAIVSNVTPGKAHDNIAYERFTQQGPIAVLPMTENRCSLVLTTHSDQAESVLALSDTEFLEHLEQRFGFRSGGFTKTSSRSAYPLTLKRIDEHFKHRAIIIGNAAHTLHPIAGQGFNLGLRDVSELAEIIHDATQTGSDIGKKATLKQYQNAREKDQHKTALITDNLSNIFSNEFLPLAKARSKGLFLTDLIPSAKHFIAQEAMGIRGKLPKLSRGLPL